MLQFRLRSRCSHGSAYDSLLSRHSHQRPIACIHLSGCSAEITIRPRALTRPCITPRPEWTRGDTTYTQLELDRASGRKYEQRITANRHSQTCHCCSSQFSADQTSERVLVVEYGVVQCGLAFIQSTSRLDFVLPTVMPRESGPFPNLFSPAILAPV
jgi:hypothetical protein